MNDVELRNEIRDFVKLIDILADGLGKTGHPIPAANNKTLYLKCCWVLSWVNKTAMRLPDENVLEFRKLIRELLPLIREAEMRNGKAKQ